MHSKPAKIKSTYKTHHKLYQIEYQNLNKNQQYQE